MHGKPVLAAVLLAGFASMHLLSGAARANLLRNPSFEQTPCVTPCNRDQGFMPSDWLTLNVTPDTYSNDGSYGLPPSGFGNFTGATAQDGIQWVAGWSAAVEIFGQILTTPLIPGQEYTLSAYLREAVRGDLAHPGTYQIELWEAANMAADKIVVGSFQPLIANQDAWELRTLAFTAPTGADTHPVLAFRPLGSGAGSAYPGIDNLVLEPVDEDGDGIADDEDNCPDTPNPDQADVDGDGAGDACDACPADARNDGDGDGVCGNVDNCPTVFNPGQADADGDGVGDACNEADDPDGDDFDTVLDNCPAVFNPNQADGDGDGVGDVCDVCPEDVENDADGDGLCESTDNCPLTANANQLDTNHDGIGDACDPDDDNDGVPDAIDNCPLDANSGQADTDGDGTGNACETDDDNDGVPDAGDQCLSTAGGATVNRDGCSVADVCPCATDWKNHGAYVNCVTHAAEDLVRNGLMTKAEKDKVVSAAASSACGRKP
jgi:Thrombospondin type 3 repeat